MIKIISLATVGAALVSILAACSASPIDGAAVAATTHAPETTQVDHPDSVSPDLVLTGTLNLNEYCEVTFGESSYATLRSPGNAYDWACVVGGQEEAMNLQTACVEQYGSTATIHLTSGSDPYSWYCEYSCTPSCPVNAVCGEANRCGGECFGRCPSSKLICTASSSEYYCGPLP